MSERLTLALRGPVVCWGGQQMKKWFYKHRGVWQKAFVAVVRGGFRTGGGHGETCQIMQIPPACLRPLDAAEVGTEHNQCLLSASLVMIHPEGGVNRSTPCPRGTSGKQWLERLDIRKPVLLETRLCSG